MKTAITMTICGALNIILNPFIFVLAVYEFYVFLKSFTKLSKLKERINALLGVERKSKVVKLYGPKQVLTEVTSKQVLNFDEFDAFCERYQEDSIYISRFSMIIQLFPLLGILGTVAGLYYAMNSGQGLQSSQDMYEGVRLALSTTIYGIIWAVLFKLCDVVLSAYFINYIEDGIDRFKDKYNEEKGLALGEKLQ